MQRTMKRCMHVSIWQYGQRAWSPRHSYSSWLLYDGYLGYVSHVYVSLILTATTVLFIILRRLSFVVKQTLPARCVHSQLNMLICIYSMPKRQFIWGELNHVSNLLAHINFNFRQA